MKIDLDDIEQQAMASMEGLEALDPYHEDDISDDDHPAGRVLLRMPYVAEVTMANHADSFLGVERGATGPCRSIRFWREADAVFFAAARRDVLALVERVRDLKTQVAALVDDQDDLRRREAAARQEARDLRDVQHDLLRCPERAMEVVRERDAALDRVRVLAEMMRKAQGIDTGSSPRPRVVCLCGSTRFWREFQAASLRETQAGRIVLSIGAATASDAEHLANGTITEAQKRMFDELHLRKIDMADEILVIDVDSYVGESTAREVCYALDRGKTIRWLTKEVASAQSCGSTRPVSVSSGGHTPSACRGSRSVPVLDLTESELHTLVDVLNDYEPGPDSMEGPVLYGARTKILRALSPDQVEKELL